MWKWCLPNLGQKQYCLCLCLLTYSLEGSQLPGHKDIQVALGTTYVEEKQMLLALAKPLASHVSGNLEHRISSFGWAFWWCFKLNLPSPAAPNPNPQNLSWIIKVYCYCKSILPEAGDTTESRVGALEKFSLECNWRTLCLKNVDFQRPLILHFLEKGVEGQINSETSNKWSIPG